MDNEREGSTLKEIKAFSQEMAAAKVTLPKHLQGQSGDCLAIAMQAEAWGMNPFAVAQATSLINGTLAYSAQLVNAVISSSTAIEGAFHYEYSGEWKNDKDPDAWVRCGAVLRGESAITWGEPLYPAQQTVKNSPLWKTNPKQQGAYQALKFWARLYTPAVILGVHTSDEIRETQRMERDITATVEHSLLKPAQDAPVPAIDNDAMQMRTLLNNCGSIDQLKRAASNIDSPELSDEARDMLRDTYKVKARELKEAAA